MILDDDIKKLLFEANDYPLDWKFYISKAIVLINKSEKKLAVIDFFQRYRENEPKEKYITRQVLNQKFRQHGNPLSCDNDIIFDRLKIILQTNIHPSKEMANDRDFVKEYRYYCLAIIKALEIVKNLIELHYIPVKTLFRLDEILNDIQAYTNDKWDELHELIEKEKQREQNSKNATKIPSKIEEYKKHSLYPELEQKIKNYRGMPKEKREIYKLIKNIIKSGNQTQARKYFWLFSKELEK